MQRHTKVEISVGAFVILGALALAYLSFTLGDLRLSPERGYTLTARFSSVGELKPGASVKLAGVNVGEVKRIALVSFSAETELALDAKVKVPEDTIASIQSAGLLGDAYVSLSAGGADKDLRDGGRITRTEPAISITELIAKYAFGSVTDDDSAEGDAPAGQSKRGSGESVPAPERPQTEADPLE
jgi:phospholipid/cholesterol/gamma-HCH transport system substrate-binding protein